MAVSVLHRRAMIVAGASALALALAGCKVVPIPTNEERAALGFNAKAFAQGLWTAKALPHFAQGAKPMPEVLQAISTDLEAAGTKYGYRAAAVGSPWSFIVSGEGTVVSKNTQSRAGTIVLALDGAQPPAEITLQIGPVIRGNAIRDSLPFITFKDFTNQLEFADAGKALTALALEGIQPSLATVAEGQRVKFTGAILLNTKSDKIIVTPVTLAAASA